ncbi:ArsA family ATPase [Acetobacterium sp. KB-1]|jgi:arsenite-transporting ATPase|uniref:ArsA family ATPase n=1 Tax=Acetobacterium sp. KB-1 TaxID=2184575 RepID=UPI000DBEC14A|nr:ArsA family ATPase [Acetobacterium sp. KB-1]AWW26227.1 ArsA family ATPase [Acetobacterium sp. KB-1]
MRIILYTGKGGVGKTSVAAATAVKLAKNGKKVLIMSTDQAHSLSDSFGVKLKNTPVKISDKLWGLEIDAILEGERAWGNMKNYMKELLTARAEGGIEAEELLVFPGLEELFSLFKITDIYEENRYDVLIVDCAPTGETLSLLKFPEMFGNMIKTVLPMKKKAVKVAGPMMEKVMKIPMPEDNVFDDVEQLNEKLYQLQAIMTNKETLSIRIVTTPERIVIKEAKRNFTYLHLYNYNIDAIIVNKVYPPKALDGYFSKWINLQEEGLKEIRESFSAVPVFTLMLLNKELATEAILLEAAEQIFGDTDPAAVLFKDTIFEVKKEEDGYAFILNVPFAEKSDLDMGQKGSELMIQIKNEKRCFTLPDVLRNKTVQSARYEEGKLRIKFA